MSAPHPQSLPAGAIHLQTELPGPKSRGLLEERRRWVSRGVPESKHGVFFDHAEGARITDVDGNVFLDFSGGIGCMNAGHSAPRVLDRTRAQADKLQHACFMVAPYESYVALAHKLCEIVPVPAPAKAVLFNSGAEAVENAIKIARAATGRPAVLAFDPGFHGRTLLALSLTSKTTPYRDGFGPFAPEVYRFPMPDMLRCPRYMSYETCVQQAIRDLGRFLKSSVNPASIACAIIEPVFGEGGFVVPPPAFLDALSKLCREHGIVLIADEVQTGFGRTGRMFACEGAGLEPDLVTLAKSMSNGFPLSAVVGRAELLDAPQPGGLGGTFGGNPIACEAALAAIETIEHDGLLERARVLGATVRHRFERFVERFPFCGEARGQGAMQALELVLDRDSMEPDKARADAIVTRAMARGVLILTAGLHGNVIRTLMPLVMTDDELEEGLNVIETCMREVQ